MILMRQFFEKVNAEALARPTCHNAILPIPYQAAVMFFDFLDRLFSFFSFLSSNSPEAVKKRQLRQLAKELSRNKFAKFYKPKSREITGEFGRFLYDVYKVIAPLQVSLQNAAKSAILKKITVESFFDKEAEEINELLSQPYEDWAKIGDTSAAVQTINEKMGVFSGIFDQDRIKAMNYRYNNLLAMVNLVSFDHFALLRRFSFEIRERNFNSVPRFANVSGIQLSVKIKDFLDLAFAAVGYSDWEQVIKIMKLYRSDTAINEAEWSKTLDLLHGVCGSAILEKMIQHIDEAPNWEFKLRLPNEHIAKEYIDAKQAEVKVKLDKLIHFQKKSLKETLLMDIFSRTEVNRAQFYNVNTSGLYTRKNFEGFVHAEAINYFMAFMAYVYKVEIKVLCDMLIIRGGWISQESYLEMSEHYHQVTAFAEKLIAFDSQFSDLGDYGTRLRSSIAHADKLNSQGRLISSILTSANSEALELINTGMGLIISMGNSFKALIDDRTSATHTLVRNWQEMDSQGLPMAERMKTASEKISRLLELLYFLTGDGIDSRVRVRMN